MIYYPLFKSLHIICMVAWFAGLFYIFRLFVYHAKFQTEKSAEHFSFMESKLIRIIMYPGMCLTILTGSVLLFLQSSFLKQSWLHLKLLGVIALVVYHLFADYTHRRFKKGDFFLSERACRIINEVPTLLLITIVCLVVFK